MKVDEYALRRVPRDVRDFIDQATLIFNYGKYSGQTLTSEPTWVARNGEFAFLSSSSQNRLYFYANNQWNWMAGSPTGGGGGSPGGPENAVQYNYPLGTFAGDSGFTYRASSAVGIARNMFYSFNIDDGSDTYVLYQTSSGYLEHYINGKIRLQM